jgi:protein-tyrosine phosphatase
MRPLISACVTAGNEERNVARCLESLRWCDEIVVVDSFSRDRTVEICRRYTQRVVQHEWLGYIGQKNFAIGLASHAWVLVLDADEEVSPALRDEILAALESDGNEYAGYHFPRQVHYLGRWICHGEWYPDVKLRLFRREFGRAEGREPHDHIVVRGRTRRLQNPIRHYTYDDLGDHVDTMNRFSTITAREQFREGERFRWIDFLFRPFWRFLKAYVFKRGFLDGRRGLLIAGVSAFGVTIKYAKLWELQRAAAPQAGPSACRSRTAARPLAGAAARRFVLLLVVLSAGAGVVAIQRERTAPRRWGAVVPGLVYRSGQLPADRIEAMLVRHRIRTVVDLTDVRTRSEDRDAEARVLAALGLRRVSAPLEGDGRGSLDSYVAAIREMRRAEGSGEPVLVHCQAGTQRAGGVTAVYRLLVQSRGREEVLSELERNGWRPGRDDRLPRFLDENMAELARRLAAAGSIPAVPTSLPRLSEPAGGKGP